MPSARRVGALVVTLQRYVLKQLLFALLIAGGGLLFVLLPALLVNAVHKVGSAGLLALVLYLPLVLADLVPYLLPLSFLLAVVTTFGRMAAEREWTAVRMAGIHPARLLIPGVVVAVLLGIGTDWLASTLAPTWKYRQRDYKRTVLQNAIRNFSPGRTEVRIPGFYLTAARRDPVKPVFYDAQISIIRKGKESGADDSVWMVAERVGFELDEKGDALVVRLHEARVIKGDVGLMNESPTIRIDFDDLIQPNKKNPDRPKFLASSEMSRRIEAGKISKQDADEYTYEIQRRHALAATYLLFLLIGFPTGIRLKSGTQLAAFAAAVAYAIAYYVLSLRLAQQLFLSETLPPALAPWITNAIGGLIGGFFTLKVLRE